MTTIDNSAQSEFWNTAPGERWVARDDELTYQHGDVAELLLAHAAPAPGERVIDIGCGSGVTTEMAARVTGPSGGATGFDISAPLLDLARRLRTGPVDFVLADAQVHEFAPASADLAMSRFGVMFFADPVAAFANIRSALVPGGRLCMVCWGPMAEVPMFRIPMEIALRRFGPLEPQDPHAPGPMAFADTARVTGLLAAAGFRDVTAKSVTTHLRHPGGAAGQAALIAHIGPTARLNAENGGTAEDMKEIIAEATAAFSEFEGADGLAMPVTVNVYAARQRA